MKLMVKGHIPAWCYVDTETGEVEQIEVCAWEDALSLRETNTHDVLAIDNKDDALVTHQVACDALHIAASTRHGAPFEVVRDRYDTLVARTRRSK